MKQDSEDEMIRNVTYRRQGKVRAKEKKMGSKTRWRGKKSEKNVCVI